MTVLIHVIFFFRWRGYKCSSDSEEGRLLHYRQAIDAINVRGVSCIEFDY